MTKKEKINKAKENLFKAGAFHEYPQFCEETLMDIIPYLNNQGLEYLIKQTQDIINQVIDGREVLLNEGWNMEDLK